MTPRRTAVAIAAGLALAPSAASAHPAGAGESSGGALVSGPWAEVGATALLLGVVAGLYLTGVGRLWSRAGAGRGVARIEAGAFLAGCAVLALALLTPLVIAWTSGFAGHMGQHLLLMAVAAPLLAFGRFQVAIAWALRGGRAMAVLPPLHRAARSRPVAAVLAPASVVAVYVAVLWAWHLPALYDAAESSAPVHVAEHATMLSAAFLLWWRVRSLAAGDAGRQVAAIGLLFAVMFPGLVLGAFITFAQEPLYQSHFAAAGDVGAALDQQQLGGLLMLMLGGLVHIGAAVALLLRVIGGTTSAAARSERRGIAS